MHARAVVIAVVVARRAVLSLIAVLNPVRIHERNHQKLNVLAQPSSLLIVCQHCLYRTLQHIAGHHLAGVVPRSQQHAIARLRRDATQAQLLHLAPLARDCKLAFLHKW